jgi:hypothetical protein
MATDYSQGDCCAAFRFESAALTYDEVSGTDLLTNNNSVSENTSDHKEGHCAAVFSGTEYFSCADASLPSSIPFKSGGNGIFTICGFFRTDGMPGLGATRTLVSKYDTNKVSFRIEIYNVFSNYFRFTLGKSDGINESNYAHGTTISDSNWYFFAVTYNNTSSAYRIHLYDMVADSILGSDAVSTHIFYPMNFYNTVLGIGGPANRFHGKIDFVTIFDTELSTDEIDSVRTGAYFLTEKTQVLEISTKPRILNALRETKAPHKLIEVSYGSEVRRWADKNVIVNHPGRNIPSDDGLILHYTFDADVSTTVYDKSKSVNNGTSSGSPDYVPGIYGSAINISAINQRVDIGTPITGAYDYYTASIWWRFYDDGEGRTYKVILADSDAVIYHMAVRTGTREVGVYNSGAFYGFGCTLSEDSWHHLCIIYNCSAGTAVLYVDGKYSGSVASIADLDEYDFGFVGSDWYKIYPSGPIDELRVYNKELTAGEIKSLYMSPAGLKGNDRFFDGKIMNDIQIGSNFNLNSFSFGFNSIDVKIANNDRIQDKDAIIDFDGSIGTIRIWCDGLNWLDIEDDGVLFKGVFARKSYDLNFYSFILSEMQFIKPETIPNSTINEDNWPIHRIEGGGGSVSGAVQQMLFGDWSRGVPLKCVHTSNYIYVAMAGVSSSTDAEYVAGTENVYDKDGDTIGHATYTFYPGYTDGSGSTVSVFDFTADESAEEPLSCSICGIADNSGEVTGTAGQLIEHPADIIYYLLLNHADISNSDILSGSISKMKSLMPLLKFALIINQASDTVSIIDRILKQCFYSRTQQWGKFGLVGIDKDSIVVDYGKRYSQVSETVKISSTPDEKVCNQLLVSYGHNPTTNMYESVLSRNKTNSSLCEQSVYKYGERPLVTIQMPDVKDDVTASILAQRYIDLFSSRHDIVERVTPIWEAWGINDGDAAELDVIEGASRDGSGWVGEKCILLDHKIVGSTVKHRWWRVAT